MTFKDIQMMFPEYPDALDAKQVCEMLGTYTKTLYKMIDGRIKTFFGPLNLKIDKVDASHINKFCESIIIDVCKQNTAIRYRALIMVAFEYAFKNDMVILNPCAKSERPKKNEFFAVFYSKDELYQLLKKQKTISSNQGFR